MRINNDQVSSIIGIIIGIFILVSSLNYDFGSLSSPSTGFFPFLLGGLIILLSVIGLVSASYEKLKGVGWDSVIKGMLWKRPFIAFISLLLYVLLVKYLGFIITTVIFMAFLLRVLEHQRWVVVIGMSVLVALVSYGIFEMGLKSQLPAGILGF